MDDPKDVAAFEVSRALDEDIFRLEKTPNGVPDGLYFFEKIGHPRLGAKQSLADILITLVLRNIFRFLVLQILYIFTVSIFSFGLLWPEAGRSRSVRGPGEVGDHRSLP